MCTIHIVVNTDSYREYEEDTWRILAQESSKRGGVLQSEMLAAIHQTLGPEFDIRSMSTARGSIEIFVTLGVVYYAVSRYKNFVDSLELLTSQLAGVVRRFIEDLPMQKPHPIPQVAATWEPGPGLIRLEVGEPVPVAGGWAYPLLWYVIASHAALLVLFMWLLARR